MFVSVLNLLSVYSADDAEIINGDFEGDTSKRTPMWSGKTLCIPSYAGAYQFYRLRKIQPTR